MKSLEKYCREIKENNKKCLVAYVAAGLNGWKESIQACIDGGADIVEVGLPFSDPIMDGPVIAKASAQAIKQGAKTLPLIAEIKEANFSVPILIMTYSNVLYSHSVESIVDVIADAGIKGLILPDVSFEHKELFTRYLSDSDIAFVPLVSTTTSSLRAEKIALDAQGFIYCVAIKGVTGQNQKINVDFIKKLNDFTTLPKYCGVGIRNEHDAKEVIGDCDGVIVGTAIVEKMLNSENANNDIRLFVESIRKTIDD